MATHSSVVAWRIPWTEEAGRLHAAAAAKSLQSCPTLCDPIDGSPPGSPVPGILQARTLEWVAISFSSAWKGKVRVKSLSRVWLFATPWTAAHQAPPPMGFSRQESWSGVPSPSPMKRYKYIKIIALARWSKTTWLVLEEWTWKFSQVLAKNSPLFCSQDSYRGYIIAIQGLWKEVWKNQLFFSPYFPP